MSENLYTFTTNGATITVRPQTGLDIINLRVLYRKVLPEPKDPEYEFWLQAANMCGNIVTQSSIEGELGYTLPNVNEAPDALRSNLKQLLALEGSLLLDWEDAVRHVNASANDPDLVPPDLLTSDQKKAPKSAKKDSDSEAK